jgi:phosphoglucomutase/phosphomannomutase
MAAGVYAANDVHVVMEDPESGRFVSTPELSYHVYRLGADGGLNVSASHNPPDDNGTKFYNPAGGQEVPPHDEELVMVASSVEEAEQMAFEDARSTGWVRYLTPEEYQGYLDENLALSLRPGCRDVGVAFSSLHGTGAFNVLPVLQQAGFHVENLERQAGLDGAFPTVPGHTANPEIPEVMAAVMDWAEARSCDIAMATDPDADRLGVAIRNSKGRFLSLTGNQIGLLVANYLLARRKEDGLLSPECWVAKTEVTTGALQALADAFGVRCIGHLLVGFKYIGDVLDHAARLGTWNGVSLAPEGFVMAMEESHGYLVSPRIRDKDAANAALILAEYAAWCAKQGTGLLQELHGIYRRLGYFATGLSSMTMEGAVGMEEIAGLQASLRANPPQEIGGRKVVSSEDRQDPAGVFGTIRSGTDASSRDVLVFTLEGGGRLVLRPSGTEPKNKTYVELWGSPAGDMGADEFVQAMGAIDEEVRQILGCWRNELMVRLQQIRNRNRGGG